MGREGWRGKGGVDSPLQEFLQASIMMSFTILGLGTPVDVTDMNDPD